MKKKIWFSVILVAFLAISFSQVAAQEPTPSDDEVNAIASQLFCPVCENTPLDVCPTTACHQWRELIRQMLADGKTEAEIKQYFVDNYGARVLSEPPAQGLNWLVYVVPPLLFVLGVVLLIFAFRTWKKTARQEAPSPMIKDGGSAESSAGKKAAAKNIKSYEAQLEEELRKRQ